MSGFIRNPSRRPLILTNPPLIPKKAPPGLQQVIPVIPSKGSWSGNANLGYEFVFDITTGAEIAGRAEVLRLPEWGPPVNWTIALSQIRPVDPWANFRASIEFGAGGITQTLLVDWSNGQVITLPMNAVSIVAITDPENTNIIDGARLRAQISRGTATGRNAPILTQRQIAEAAFPVPVPDFARALRPFVQSPPADTALAFAATTRYDFLDSAGATIYSVLGSNINPGLGIPIPGGSQELNIDESTGSTPNFTLVWDIAY